MLIITNLKENVELFQALGSEVRIEIIRTLLKQGPMSIGNLANELHLSNGAMTNHINKLVSSGILKIDNTSQVHRNQKMCSTNIDRLLIVFSENQQIPSSYDTEIKIGHYTDYQVYPYCGLATANHIIGQLDDPRYFSHPERFDSDILWFTRGYVEYIIPNLMPPNQKMEQMTFSMEISSEAPKNNNNWPSDIYFHINNHFLGYWTSPGDFGDKKGILSPRWWSDTLNQYGLLKTVTINGSGTFMDGIPISNVTIEDLHLTSDSIIKLRFSVPENAQNKRGFTIFGSNFGNHKQNINIHVDYRPIEQSAY